MNVLVVDDEPLARDWLARLLKRMDNVQLCGEASNGDEAIEKARVLGAEVVLLDIQIPGKNGLEVAIALGEIPVIFTTAHGHYALEAWELDACDYLVKPIEYEQLLKSLERARRRRSFLELMRQQDEAPVLEILGDADQETLAVNDRRATHFIKVSRVTRFRAANKYTLFQCDGIEHIIRDSLEKLEVRFSALGFIRVHRSELIRKSAIVSLVHQEAGAMLELVDGQRVAVSRRYLSATKRALGLV